MTDENRCGEQTTYPSFYKEVLVEWNMTLVDEVVSPQFRSHDWPQGFPTGPQGFRDFYSAVRSAVPDGAFGGIAATGNAITLKGIAI